MSGVRTVLALSKALTTWALHGHRDMQEPVRGLQGAWAKVLVPPGLGREILGAQKECLLSKGHGRITSPSNSRGECPSLTLTQGWWSVWEM